MVEENKPKEMSAEEQARITREEHDRLKSKDEESRKENLEALKAAEEARRSDQVDPGPGGLHPGARPPIMKRDIGGRPTFPNVPKAGYKTNPANIQGAQLPPERQAPRPEDPMAIGTGASKGPAMTLAPQARPTAKTSEGASGPSQERVRIEDDKK
jgi:hypothetical protein